jgi:hypothetical protein
VGDCGDVSLTGPYEDEEDEEGVRMDDYTYGDPLKELLAEQKKRKAAKAKRAKTSKNKKK